MAEVKVRRGLDVTFDMQIHPHEDGGHKYSYYYQDEDTIVSGDGKIYSPTSLSLAKLSGQIINMVEDKLE